MELWQVEDGRPPCAAIVVSNLPADIRCRVTRVANAIDQERARRVYTPVSAPERSAFHRPRYRIATAGYIVYAVRFYVPNSLSLSLSLFLD